MVHMKKTQKVEFILCKIYSYLCKLRKKKILSPLIKVFLIVFTGQPLSLH